MNESKTFFDESILDNQIYYDIHEDEITCRPDDMDKFCINWWDIQYIEDCSDNRVDISSNNQKDISIRYTTNDFTGFLKTICLKLAKVRKESFYSQKFTLTWKYLLHFGFVISILVLLLLGSLAGGKYLFFMFLILFIPVGIFVQRQPISLTIDNHGLIVRTLFTKNNFYYSEIQDMDFEINSNDYGSTLFILIKLKNKKTITVKKFQDMILFFIMLQIKLNENLNQSPQS